MTVSGIATLVKQAVDILDVIGRVVPLRRSGNRHIGLCPFHQEKTPSFHVDAENQLYHCFGCGTGGDVLSFVMKHQNLSFSEAVRFLSERYNIPLPRDDRSEDSALLEASRKERDHILAAVGCAADFFHRELHCSPEGKIARDYIVRRGLPAELVQTQRLGYAPARWDGLSEHLKKNGVDPEVACKAGLLGRRSNDASKFYDRFRNRLIFPIADERGRIVAFGGRILSQDEQNEPKYLNSPETPVYHKGRMLYQFAVARDACRNARQVLLVEGYMDLLAFHARNFHRVAATLGTALTAQQVRLLSRIADEVVLAYDGDEAGERAMARALPLFLQDELSVSCIRFPAGMDPDDFLKHRGMPEFERLVERREELGTYVVRKAIGQWDGSSASRAAIFSELRPLFREVRQPLLRSEYLRLIAERFSVPEEVAEAQLLHEKRGKSDGGFRAPRYRNLPETPEIGSLEEKVLRCLIRHPDLSTDMLESGALACFRESRLSAIAEVLCRVGACAEGECSLSAVYDLLPDSDLRELYTRYLLEPCELSEPEIQLRDWIEALLKRAEKQHQSELKQALQEAEKEGNASRMRAILLQIRDLTAKANLGDFSDNVSGDGDQ